MHAKHCCKGEVVAKLDTPTRACCCLHYPEEVQEWCIQQMPSGLLQQTTIIETLCAHEPFLKEKRWTIQVQSSGGHWAAPSSSKAESIASKPARSFRKKGKKTSGKKHTKAGESSSAKLDPADHSS